MFKTKLFKFFDFNFRANSETRIPGVKYLLSFLETIQATICCKYNFLFKRKEISKDFIDGNIIMHDILKRNSIISNYSSSDDGGFLPRKRRPIVSWPSQLSITQSIESEQSNYSRLLKRFNLQHVFSQRGIEEQKNEIQELYRDIQQSTTPVLYINTPIRSKAQIHSSSPATAVLSPPFSDLSSVHPSSLEHVANQQNNSRFYHYDRYFHTLPRLNAILEENIRFIPVRPTTPDDIPIYQNYPLHHKIDFRTRHQPIFRSRRSLPDTSYPSLNSFAKNVMDSSPSDSSGIGSKNTSSQHQSLNSSGLLNELRFIPSLRVQPAFATTIQRNKNLQSPSHYPISYWLDLIAKLKGNQTDQGKQRGKWNKDLDVGSVDGHYEFDPCTPTPSISTPTGLEFTDNGLAQRKKLPRFDSIDARVQAMKEEFYLWRQKQAAKHEQHNVNIKSESVC